MALSQAQVDAINSAIDATQAYADQLQAALGKASAQGNFNAAAAISSRSTMHRRWSQNWQDYWSNP